MTFSGLGEITLPKSSKKAVLITCVKGGTGKTIFAVNLAHKLVEYGPTALIDADLDNANFAQFTGVNSFISITPEQQFKPYKWGSVEVFSMSLIGERDQSVSMEASRYVQILDDVLERSLWDAQYFVLDMPGGSSDVFRAGVEIIAEYLTGSIIVTQPSMVDATRKSLNLHEYFEIPVLGLVENMSFFQIGNKKVYPFGKSCVDEIAKEYNVKVLGKIPLSLEVAEGIEKGDPILKGDLAIPIENAAKEFLAAPVRTPGFWAKIKEKISEAFKEEIEKVLIQFILTLNKAFNINALRTSSGFRDSKPFILVITDESGTKEISSVALRITETAIKVIQDPKDLDFQIATDFRTLARMIMGQRKNREGKLVPYRPEDAWYHGDLKAYGLGYTQYAIRAFRTIFSDENTITDLRNRLGPLLKGWI